MTAPRHGPGAIPTSRLLVGILLHVCVPAYLIGCLATALLVAPVVDGWAALPGRMMWTAAWFGPAFLLALAAAAVLGVALDRRRDRRPDAVAVSRAQWGDARRRLDALPHPRLARALARLDKARWDHGDERHQRLAADCDAAARAFSAASESATPERRAAILDLAADSVEQLADAHAALADERRRLDDGDARTLAGYIDKRYDPS